MISGCSPQPAAFASVDVSGAEYARNFELTDHNGQTRKLQDFAGKVVVMFFGYTQCPDVCPTTLSEMAEVKKALGQDGDRLQVLFVSVDPERDTPAVLKTYVAYFHPQMLGAVGNASETAAVAKQFGAGYVRQPTRPDGGYAVDHSSQTYLVDTQGRLVGILPHGASSAQVAAAVRQRL